MTAPGPTLPTLAVQQDGSYLGCTGNRLTYGPARRRIGSDNGPSGSNFPAVKFKNITLALIANMLKMRMKFAHPTGPGGRAAARVNRPSGARGRLCDGMPETVAQCGCACP